LARPLLHLSSFHDIIVKVDGGNAKVCSEKDLGMRCPRFVWPEGCRALMSTMVDPAAFRRLLRERCLTAEELRQKLGLSYTTLAKLNRGAAVSDVVFRRVVLELGTHPVVPIAQELLPAGAANIAQEASA
jgi:hypothetical protein